MLTSPTETQVKPGEIPLPEPQEASLFLDFDGTLVDLGPTPDGIEVPGDLPDLLRRLQSATSGRVVIVTGRSVASLVRHLDLDSLHVVGAHGAESQRGGIVRSHRLAGSAVVHAAHRAAADFAKARSGLLVETKPTGVVLHYRAAPGLAGEVQRFVAGLAAALDGLEFHQSKCACELRPDDTSKDRAVAELMADPAFSASTPIYVGDDATDEPALALVERSGGVAVKVGEGETAASWRLPDPAAVRTMLWAWAERTR